MNSLAVTTRWVRGLRSLLVLLVGACVLTGLGYTWRAAWRGEVLGAAIGAAATLALLVAAVLWSVSLRLALAVLRTQRRMARMERRLGMIAHRHSEQDHRLGGLAERLGQTEQSSLRARQELVGQISNIQSRLGQRFEGLLARLETFSKLHDEQAERLERRLTALEKAWRRGADRPDATRLDEAMAAHWAVPDEPPGQRTVTAYQQLVEQPSGGETASESAVATGDPASDKHRLRSEFAQLIHGHDYEAALVKGDEIEHRFPESSAAADFRRVRPHLVRRIELAQAAETKSGV